jgi:hypothetical protein
MTNRRATIRAILYLDQSTTKTKERADATRSFGGRHPASWPAHWFHKPAKGRAYAREVRFLCLPVFILLTASWCGKRSSVIFFGRQEWNRLRGFFEFGAGDVAPAVAEPFAQRLSLQAATVTSAIMSTASMSRAKIAWFKAAEKIVKG